MNILAVDDERMALAELVNEVGKVDMGNQIYDFTKPREALELVKSIPCQVAFLDIQMRGMTGLELAKRLKEVVPDINIIFVTGYSEYGVDAMGLRASGYLLKPVTMQAIREELENLRNPVVATDTHRLKVQTFGNFEIFCDGAPVAFGRVRSKEVLAYLIDIRGTSASYAEVAAILWEDGIYDRGRQKQMNNYIHDIKHSLQNVQAEEMLISTRKTLRVDPEQFDCDYYKFLEGDVPTINSYTGKYMSAYSWAELTIAYLDNQNIRE